MVTGDTDTPGFSGSVSVRPRSAASTASRETPGSPAPAGTVRQPAEQANVARNLSPNP